MVFLGFIGITLIFTVVMALVNNDPPKKKSYKRKKNFFVRLGESGNPKYNWMGGYTESD